MDVPDLDEALIDRIVEQSDEQAAGRTVMQLENERDRNLVALLKRCEPKTRLLVRFSMRSIDANRQTHDRYVA